MYICHIFRDWCDLSKQTGLYVVNEILSGENKESILENIHGKLREVKDAVHSGDIPIDLYYITKVAIYFHTLVINLFHGSKNCRQVSAILTLFPA